VVRLWLADDKEKLLKAFADVARSEQKMEVDSSANGKYLALICSRHGPLTFGII